MPNDNIMGNVCPLGMFCPKGSIQGQPCPIGNNTVVVIFYEIFPFSFF